MSALHALPTAAVAASLKNASASASADAQADPGVSFAAALSAQLGLAQAPRLPGLVSGADDQAAPTKPGVSATDPAVVDPTVSLTMMPLASPIIPAQAQAFIQTDEGAPGSQTGKSTASHRTILPGAAISVRDGSDAIDRSESSAPEVLEPEPPANFAAVLQGLPHADEDNSGHRGALPQADASAAAAQPVALSIAPERRAENMHHAPSVTTAVSVPVQDAKWGDSFSEKVVWITGQQVQAAEIHVDPPQLGPIEVRVSITNDQANLLFTAPHAVARDAIQMSLPRLQEMLFDSGLTLGNVSVGAHTPREQQPGQGERRANQGSGSDAVAAAAGANASPLARIQHQLGLVDLFA